jgi:UDP:flavonoid glycosyltransferase YjiC (YdhE family)
MRILIATVPFSGHFNPLTAVAARLREQGHEVRWYAAPSLVPRVEALGVAAEPYRRAVEVSDDNVAELHPERAKLKGPKRLSFDFARVFTDNIPAQVTDLTDLHKTWPFERLVCDSAFYAASILGPKLDVPVHTVSPGPSLVPSHDVPPPFFGLRPARHIFDRLVQRVIKAMVESTMKEGLVTFNQARAEARLASLKAGQVLGAVEAIAQRIYQVGIPEVEFPRTELPAGFEYVGALLPRVTGTSPHPALDRITTWPGRVVVVSQGTVDNRDHDKLLVPALEALARDDVLVVAVTGGSGTDALRRRFPSQNVIIADHIDFATLFPHTDLFVCNGGNGSVLLALAHGVPLVLAGTREGKNDINARLAWNGLAVDLRTEHPKPTTIARAAASVLDDPTMRDRVARVSDQLAAYDSVDLVTRGILSSVRGAPSEPIVTHVDPASFRSTT